MNVAIIAAAGRGTRAGGGQAKQFRELRGVPIIIHTLQRFEQCRTIGEIIVVVPAHDAEEFSASAEKFRLRKLARVVAGGETRTETVWRGLSAVSASEGFAGVVAVHDGVRPFVMPGEIDRTVLAAEESGAAILAAPAVDTIKEGELRTGVPHVARTLERARLWHAQTPQCFRYELLRRAYEHALAEGIEATDDSALVERLGTEVRIVEGGAHNIKLTTAQDFALAEIFIKSPDFG
ncbi:MAG TPA: 2-C-methyl-D-erythritol 4-phosphate cytidylyltransferase [Pyrinomonadaceae bacterium]|nr:2-C-methyl-D-erythritol 4-phosphate cytidylyltransferase [Pyrinomonadaceae bacterium]